MRLPYIKISSNRWSCLFFLDFLVLLICFADGIRGNNLIPQARPAVSSQYSSAIRRRNLNHHHKSRYYEFLDDDSKRKHTTLSDVWICLACALGWSIWFVSTQQPPQQLLFEQRDSQKVSGHVLQVSLGEDNLGTGIPMYHAVVDYVVEADVDGDPLQIRKVFSTRKLLEEGFANVEVIVLTDDPTTAILVEDFLEQKKELEAQGSPSIAYYILTYSVAIILIGASLLGAVLAILRLNNRLYGWISLAFGTVLLYPVSIFLYRTILYVYSLAGPLTERPGTIIHGERMHCTSKRCNGMIDPFEVFGDDEGPSNGRMKANLSKAVELASLQVPSMKNQANKDEKKAATTGRKLLFPNAGCGFGSYNVHLPDDSQRTDSSVSSMSASQNSNEKNEKEKIARTDTSILEKYEMHVAATLKNNKR